MVLFGDITPLLTLRSKVFTFWPMRSKYGVFIGSSIIRHILCVSLLACLTSVSIQLHLILIVLESIFTKIFEKKPLAMSERYKEYFNAVWPCDGIWQGKSESTRAHVISCWLMASSHCLNRFIIYLSKIVISMIRLGYKWYRHIDYAARLSWFIFEL